MEFLQIFRCVKNGLNTSSSWWITFITGTKIRRQLGSSSDCWVGGALLSKMAALLRAIVASWWNDASHSLRSVLEALSSPVSIAQIPPDTQPEDRPATLQWTERNRFIWVSSRVNYLLIVSRRCHFSSSGNRAPACGFFLSLLLSFVVVSWVHRDYPALSFLHTGLRICRCFVVVVWWFSLQR